MTTFEKLVLHGLALILTVCSKDKIIGESTNDQIEEWALKVNDYSGGTI